jgi:GntR family transcriptional regulator
MPSLDAGSPLPLYAQIAEHLERQMRDGELRVGDRLPSEHALAESYQVGRPTVRQATESLVRAGKLQRRRGAGTFVCEPPVRVDLFSLAGTLSSFSREGIRLRTSFVKRPKRMRLPADEHSPLAGREVYSLTRLGRVDGEPVLLETFAFDAEVFEHFDKLALTGRALSEVVADHYGLAPSSAEQSFSAQAAEGALAAQLDVDEGTAILRVDRTLHFPGAPAAVHALMHCRTERFAFSHHIGDPHA